MNNQELELKVKELLNISNFFDMIIAVKEFEKEYKNSEFFKATKMPLMDVIKNAKVWYSINLDVIVNNIQRVIDNLDLSKLNQIIEQLGNTFTAENEEFLNIAELYKELTKSE